MNPNAAFFCLWMVVVYSAGEKLTKTKRDVSGLYPFPRVGKEDTSWSSQIIGPREMKRQGLIPFPRVGRNRGNEVSGKKRDMVENGGGMWFGPRLGRLQKRKYFNEDEGWALVQIKEDNIWSQLLRSILVVDSPPATEISKNLSGKLSSKIKKLYQSFLPDLRDTKENLTPNLNRDSSEETDQSRDYRL